MRTYTSGTGRVLVALLLVMATMGGCKNTKPNPNRVALKESDLPAQQLHLLNKGDVVEYVLPTGRHLSWEVESDVFGCAEQTTACGLKAHTQQPPFEELKDYEVCTCTGDKISIYSFSVDGYRVELAEDLKASHCLPVIIRVFPVGKEKDMDHEVARAFFAEHVAATTSQPLRVPISTVHHGLNQEFPFPVRLVVINNFPVRLVGINNEIAFQVSGDVFGVTEEERQAKLVSVMNYVVDRYEGIDRISSFSIDVLKGDDTAFRYEARKDHQKNWALHKR